VIASGLSFLYLKKENYSLIVCSLAREFFLKGMGGAGGKGFSFCWGGAEKATRNAKSLIYRHEN